MDLNTESRTDWERRRKIRLAQVRDQSKILAKIIRDRVHNADEVQLEKHENLRHKTEQKFKSLACNKLKSDFNYLIQDIGNGYTVASTQFDPSIALAEKRLINRCTAISRGFEAEKRQQQLVQEQLMDKAMRESKIHFNKTIEKIRSRLITSIPNIDGCKNHVEDNIKQNECFLIPSQIILNEKDIKNWNYNKKTSKLRSVAFNNNNENQMANNYQHSTNGENKENEPYLSKLTKIETDLKNYESLVSKLNILSAEEQNIRDKLFTRYQQENPMLSKISVPTVTQENHKHTEITRNQHTNKSAELSKIINNDSSKQFESNSKSSFHISSATSTSTNDEYPLEALKKIKKTTHFKNLEENHSDLQCSSKLKSQKKFTAEKPLKSIHKYPVESFKKTNYVKNEKNAIQSSSYNNYKNKLNTEKPLKKISNTVQRIKNKKQLLKKEISAGSKKIKIESPNPKMTLVNNRCAAGSDLLKMSPTNYAMLPDSFYNQLDSLKKQFSKKKSNHSTSINANLIQYIDTLLKMTPSDIDNLSVSSCSSIKLEESVLQNSSKNEQYYSEILNCISKCLNADISDLSQDAMFDSPKNINFLNRLQNLTNYYLDKTREMKNICDESSLIENYQNTETKREIINENRSTNMSSDSSVDGEYILRHLNAILQKKGLIRSDKEWPMFENFNDDDDNRSLTDQLLDIYPRVSSCTCQKHCVQHYIGNNTNETPLQRPLENINEMLNWIKRKKRLLFEEIYTNQAPLKDLQSMNSKSDTYKDSPKENVNYIGLPDSFYNGTIKILEEYVKNKKQKSKSNNNNTWINMELMRYICNLLKMSPNEIDNLSVSSNSSIQLEQSILEISKANLEYHKDILNYISNCLDSNVCDINRDQAFCSPQYIGLLDKLYKLADYYTEKAQEMRNICSESPRVEINNIDEIAVEQISENITGDRKASCSLSSELSVDGAYVLDHLSTLLEQRGLICPNGEWPLFGNDDEDDSRSLTDQLLDIKSQIKSKDIHSNIKEEYSEKGKHLFKF